MIGDPRFRPQWKLVWPVVDSKDDRSTSVGAPGGRAVSRQGARNCPVRASPGSVDPDKADLYIAKAKEIDTT
jgi:hypothetical protein